MDHLRLRSLKSQLLCHVITVILFRTTLSESNQSTLPSVKNLVIHVSSTPVSYGTNTMFNLLGSDQPFKVKNLTLKGNTTHKQITATSQELPSLDIGTFLPTLPNVDEYTKTTKLYASLPPILTSFDRQSLSHMTDNNHMGTDQTVYIGTSTERQSKKMTMPPTGMNSSITHRSVPEFEDISTLRSSPEIGPTTMNTESLVGMHNNATGSYETELPTSKASYISVLNEFTTATRTSIISVLASSLSSTTFVTTEKSSSSSPSSSASYSSLAIATSPYDLALGLIPATITHYHGQLNRMLAGGQGSHADMSVSSTSMEMMTDSKVKVKNYSLLGANTVITTSQAQTRSTSSRNYVNDLETVSSDNVDNRSIKVFSPATLLQPSPTVSTVNKYTTTITINLPPIEERNEGQHLKDGISSTSHQNKSRQFTETIIHLSSILAGSKDSSSRSSITLDRSQPYRNRSFLTTPKNKILSASAGTEMTSSMLDRGWTNAEMELTTTEITSQSSLIPADERVTDKTASSVQQVNWLSHVTHEETISHPCANIDKWKTTSFELKPTSTDSILKPLKHDVRFAITFQGDCKVLAADSKLQLDFWESIISFVCGTLHLQENIVQPEDIICPPLKVYFTLKQITRYDAFEVLNYTMSNNSFQVQIIVDSEPVIYRSQFIQILESTNDRHGRSVSTLERLDIIIISIAGVLFFVLLVACSCICCREIYRRKHVQMFQLKETPHVSVKVEDYTLTRIPRTKVIYADNHMLTEEDLGLNHQQNESSSKENGGHHLNESVSTADIDQCQHERGSKVKSGQQQNECSSEVNSEHNLHESELKITGDCYQNESGSKVSGDPDEARENKLNQDSIIINVRSHTDGIVIGVTCSPSQIPKITKPLSECLNPTEKELSGESSQSLVEKSEEEEGMSNPNCRVDDERYAGHTSTEEDELL